MSKGILEIIEVLKQCPDTLVKKDDIIFMLKLKYATINYKQINMENTEQQPQDVEQKKQLTIGEEFIQWAVDYWGMQKVYDAASLANSGESVNFDVIRKYLASGLDEMIESKLGLKK